MRLKTRQYITAGLILAMMLLFLIPVLSDEVPVKVHILWQMAEVILLYILSAVWHDYNKR